MLEYETNFEIDFQTEREALIWCAQGLDSDGSIFSASTYSRRPRVNISFCNKNKDWIELIQWILPEFQTKKVHKSEFGLYTISITSHEEVANVLQRLIPFLTIKRDIAEIALEIVEVSLEKKHREYSREEQVSMNNLQKQFEEAAYLKTENPEWGNSNPRINSRFVLSAR
jgi:hypothetical protein